jgi:hypothetical protein
MARSENIKVLQGRLEEKGYRCTDMLNKSNGTTHQIIEKYQNGGKTIIVERWYQGDDIGGIDWNELQLCEVYVRMDSNNSWEDFFTKLEAAL